MMRRLILLLLLASSIHSAHAESALVFREDWKEIPWALRVTQEHVANKQLRLELHGPGLKGIKKSHHENIENDPFYIWSGKCERNWALSLSHRKSLVDLSADDAKIRWRSRQSGGRKLHLILRLPGDRWFVSEEADPESKDWHEFEFAPAKLKWRRLNIIKVSAGEELVSPDLRRVDAVGFTDLATGGGSKVSSRLDWIEVHGRVVERPARKKPAVKNSRVVPKLPDSVEQHLGLTFAKYGKREMKLDLYTPKAASASEQNRPAVVFIHGGGWYKGTPATYTPMAQKLAAAGFVTANIEYRLAGEAPFPAAIQDCKAVVRWLRANAEKYRIDPARIGAVGGSAGGHLCALLATSGELKHLDGEGGNAEQSSAIQAAVVMAGAMDLTTEEHRAGAAADPRQRLVNFMGGTWDEAQQNYVDASPYRHIDAKTPPLCFMDGEFDRPGQRYIATIEKLDALKIPHESHVIKNAPHPFWSVDPFFQPALERVEAFFKKHLSR